jgi:branched-subunit amino acid ABC-type transport system permease component
VKLVLILGCSLGMMYALVGLGLVLEYRYSKVVNLAHGGQAIAAAYIFNVYRNGSYVLAFGGALLASTATGLLIEYIAIERMRRSSVFVKTLVTLGFLLVILGICQQKWGVQTYGQFIPDLFTSRTVGIFGVRVGVDQMVAIALTLAIAAGLTLFFKLTSLGIALRAAGDRPVLAQTTGIDSTNLGRVVWSVGGFLAGLAGIMLAPTLHLDPIVYVSLIIVAYSAMLVARMESLALTVVGGLVLGVSQQMVSYLLPRLAGAQAGVALTVALVALLYRSNALEWAEAQEAI